MKVRRSGRSVDLRNLPLDGFDMFLLVQIEGTLSVAELCDIAPCDRSETIRRLNQLARFDVVELVPENTEERYNVAAAKRAAQQTLDFDDETTTLRPPPRSETKVKAPPQVKVAPPQGKVSAPRPEPSRFGRTLAEDDATTIRPPAPVPVQEMMRAADESTVRSVIDRSSGVVERRSEVTIQKVPTFASEARSVRDRSVFSRATLIDEDVEERARAFEEPRPVTKR